MVRSAKDTLHSGVSSQLRGVALSAEVEMSIWLLHSSLMERRESERREEE